MSVITKNLNWEVLKDGIGLRMKNFKIHGFTKNSDLSGVHEKPIYREELLKREGSLDSLQIYGGTGKK